LVNFEIVEISTIQLEIYLYLTKLTMLPWSIQLIDTLLEVPAY